jgi:hypothetical protein
MKRLVLFISMMGLLTASLPESAHQRRRPRSRRHSRRGQRLHLGGPSPAARLVALLALFNRQLMSFLLLPFLILTGLAIGVGWLWTRRDPSAQTVQRENPRIHSKCWQLSFSHCCFSLC